MTAFLGGLILGLFLGAVGALFALALCAAAKAGDAHLGSGTDGSCRCQFGGKP